MNQHTNRHAIGGNRPPSQIDSATAAVSSLGAFLQFNPTIDSTSATPAAKLIDTTRRVLADLDDERRGKVDPLNQQVRDINDEYRPIRESVEKLLNTLRNRLTVFTAAEENRRLKEAAEARRRAEEAARLAREAEEAERQAAIDAEFGSPIDIAEATVEADQTFADFKKADRQAKIAERDTIVRLGTGIGRAVSMRNKETLHVDDLALAVEVLGPVDGIIDAVLSAARAYRKLNGRLPRGIRADMTREI